MHTLAEHLYQQAYNAERREFVDRAVPRTGAEKSARIDLGLALCRRTCAPGTGKTRQEIAAWAGCSPARIQQIEARALRKLRARLSSNAILRDLIAHLLPR
jgi:predicted Fe-S protein YdhL (DUF1289 family)